MRLSTFLIPFLLLGMTPVNTFAKDICLLDSYQAKWRINFKPLKKPGQFSTVTGFRLEDKIVPVYGTALMRGDGDIKLGLYANRSQDVPGFTDFTVSIVGSKLFFTRSTTESADGKLVDVGGTVSEAFTLTQIDCKTAVILTAQP